MISGLTSIIIPTFNHGDVVADAIESALAQTAPVEVIVIDDGSTDQTADVLRNMVHSGARMRWRCIDHSGPAAARNWGIEMSEGEFVTFLDADDLIEPGKVAEQVLNMTPDVGFVLCDVLIREVGGREELASERYHYADKGLGGWIADLLEPANFVPIMSPLIRRSVLGDSIRFPIDRHPEDWPFMCALAAAARCRYIPDVLATYRKRAGSRNATAKLGQPIPPLRLNLGCGDPAAASWHPVPGFVNLDKALGWRFEDGLRCYADASVAAITISHALMYVDPSNLPAAFAEFARVLEPGGVIRITEDDTSDPASRTYRRGWHDARLLTDSSMMRHELERAGFVAHDVTAESTRYRDRSLCQSHHGKPPHVFYVEGVRECNVLLSPHADDESLFAAFTIIRHRPRVVICFPSSGDYGDTGVRLSESQEAIGILTDGRGQVEQWDGVDIEAKMRELDARLRPTRIWAPSPVASHRDHVAVALAATKVFGDRLQQYHTYNVEDSRANNPQALGKVRSGAPVAFEQDWIERKRRALACYRSQIEHPRARIFFDDDLAEYRP